MCNEEPKVSDHSTHKVCETCSLLKVGRDWLNDRRKKGLITPVNPDNPARYRYSGASIKRLWRIENGRKR